MTGDEAMGHAERMDELAAFHHVSLTVANLDVSVEWYQRVLRFEEWFREEHDDRRACVMGFAEGGCSVGLVQHRGDPEGGFAPTRIGLDHLAFAVSTLGGIHEWATRLDDLAVTHSGVIEIAPGAILNLKDPDGIALSLFWDRSPTAQNPTPEPSALT